MHSKLHLADWRVLSDLVVVTSDSDNSLDVPVNIVDRIRKGDEYAFESVFREYTPRLVRFALKFGISSFAAEDVVTNVFISLWEARHRLDVSKNLNTYLYRAVRNRALDILRAKRRESARYERAVALGDIPGLDIRSRTIDAVTEAEEAADIVWAAAALLPESQRTALMLRYTHEMSIAEIADSMELSAPAIKSLLQRAHRTLRERLGGIFQDL